jgi:hypothetical protein
MFSPSIASSTSSTASACVGCHCGALDTARSIALNAVTSGSRYTAASARAARPIRHPRAGPPAHRTPKKKEDDPIRSIA